MNLSHQTSAPIRVAPVRPSAAVKDWYHTQLAGLVDAMHQSVMFWVRAAWRRGGLAEDVIFTQGDLAMDLSPAKILQGAMEKLGAQWRTTFKLGAKGIADGFASKALAHGDQAFRAALRDAGFSVKFQASQTVRDALDALTMDNVGLIKSIPEEYLGDVHGKVARSIAAGRNLRELTDDLQRTYHVARNRAALIARDQNNKATAIVHRVRQREVGVKHAVWVHSGASKHPREEHEAWGAEGATYVVSEGMYSEEDGENVWPGTPINCGCISMSVIEPNEEGEEE